jgi:hypothetical protein
LTLLIVLDTPESSTAGLSRRMGANKGSQYTAWTTQWDKAAGKNTGRYQAFPTTATAGRLRLVRTGSALSYYVSEGSDTNFTFLQEFPFGNEDLKDVRIVAYTDGPQAALDARFTDLRIRMGALPAVPVAAPPKSRWKLWLTGAIVGLLLTSSLGVWLYARHSRRTGRVPTPAPGEELQGRRASPGPAPGRSPAEQSGRRLWLPALGLLAALGVGLIAWQLTEASQLAGAPGGARESPTEFYHDFRSQLIPPGLTPFGDPEGQLVRAEPEGLRITLPKDRESLSAVGFATEFGMQGDFEMTMTYEILEAEEPPSGYGVGVGMFVKKADPSPEAATLSRMVRARVKEVVLWDRSVEVLGGKPRIEEGVSPSPAKVGRLRMKRTGTTLYYLWAPGTTGEDFQEVQRCEFGADAIKRMTVSALTGRQPCHLDARLIDWRIRSGIPSGGTATVELPAPAAQKSRWKLWLGGGILGLAVTLSVGVWLHRHYSRAGELRARAPAGDQQAEAVAPTPPVSFACSSCNKKLKAKASLAGKEVKCPRCGKAVLVPENQASDTGRGLG